MKVIGKVYACGITYTIQPNEKIDLPDEIAFDLISCNYAEAVEEDVEPEVKVDEPIPEPEIVKPVKETAVKRPYKKKTPEDNL